MKRMTMWGVVGLIVLVSAAALRAEEPKPSAEDVFRQRILPIFHSPNPSSCIQCHLASVDLKDYIRPSHEQTFRSLRDQGLIDLDRPEDSKILRLIRRGEGESAGVALIRPEVRRAESEAFAAWIKACAADPALRNAPPLAESERAKPAAPAAVIRHGRADRLLESFERNVWAWRFRCMNCHTEGTPQNTKHRERFGNRVAWVKRDGAAATMAYLLQSRLIDVGRPEKSLLLAKPLGVVAHEGGQKFQPGDEAYKGFRTWLEDVAALRAGRYTSAAALPPDAGPERFGSDVWLKFTDTPREWGGHLLQVNVFAWDAATGAWEKEPIATSDRMVAGQARLWQHNLTLLAAKGSERARAWRTGPPTLPPGRYLVQVSVDRAGRLARDWTATLGESDDAGAVEVRSAWPEGYDRMTTVDAGRVRR